MAKTSTGGGVSYGVVPEMRHSKSEDLLGAIPNSRSTSPTIGLLPSTASEDDLIAASALHESTDRHRHRVVVAAAAAAAAAAAIADTTRRLPPSSSTTSSSPSSSSSTKTPNKNNDNRSTTTTNLFATKFVGTPPGLLTDRIDPEDSIRDIVTENDLYRFVLFKRHYDKYVALAAKYEEAKDTAYYLEERYHEVKAERDKLEEARRCLEKRLEGCEAELRGKEDDLFLQLERSLRLEEEVERAKVERDSYIAARDRLDQQRETTLRRLQLQLAENEATRQSLERARLDVIRQATVIRAERDALEKENETLKEKLRIGEDELGIERRRREEGVAALTRETITLRHAARHLRAATIHATSCRRRRRCSICLYTQRTFAEVDDYRDDGNLFKCLQAPLQDLCTWLRPSTTTTAGPSSRTPRTSSPLAEREIAYIDDSSVDSSGGGSTNGSSDSTTSSTTSNSSSNSASDDEAYPSTLVAAMSLSSANSNVPPTNRAFSSDSGFSSEVGDRRSRCFENGCSSTSSSSGCSKTRKISESLSCSEPDDQGTVGRGGGGSGSGGGRGGGGGGGGFTRSKWTSSFRKLLGRKLKSKSATTSNSGGGGGSSS
ncbi:keratin, type II cytoskeletal 1-like [Vespa mandarinia]|uniref:keratin, type II cytoskeletal 1-like n=1 Tax=Vespa mandarinia TaxID=7446 RepID=UPI00160992FD|nr:keratin, type II cytoskeletal 1-like [Vespa mandarinia]